VGTPSLSEEEFPLLVSSILSISPKQLLLMKHWWLSLKDERMRQDLEINLPGRLE
jgi:hypothetical protein